ncbi:hypothetical protein Q3G72_024493 [Acer saccharum]|nr:hypothetical protein Q3G72_024493 [Acer saccharum]
MFVFSSSKNPQISRRIQASLAPGSRSLGAGIRCGTAHLVPCCCKDFFDFVLVIVVKVVATPDSAVELPLTAKNVENVMDEVRPYLIADGGNVALHEIDGNIVRLKLQGVGSRVSKCVYLLFLPLLVFVEYVKD